MNAISQPNEGAILLRSTLGLISKTNPKLTDEKINRILTLYENTDSGIEETDYLLKRSEVAKALRCSPRTVDYHCRNEDFKRIILGNSTRTFGISAQSVAKATGLPLKSLLAARDWEDKCDRPIPKRDGKYNGLLHSAPSAVTSRTTERDTSQPSP